MPVDDGVVDMIVNRVIDNAARPRRAPRPVRRRGLDTLRAEGTLAPAVPDMQTRAELYDLLDYADYNSFDDGIFNFSLEGHRHS